MPRVHAFFSSLSLSSYHDTLFLSIFVAFILEAFMLQYDSTVSKFETAVEKKIGELGVGVGM